MKYRTNYNKGYWEVQKLSKLFHPSGKWLTSAKVIADCRYEHDAKMIRDALNAQADAESQQKQELA